MDQLITNKQSEQFQLQYYSRVSMIVLLKFTVACAVHSVRNNFYYVTISHADFGRVYADV